MVYIPKEIFKDCTSLTDVYFKDFAGNKSVYVSNPQAITPAAEDFVSTGEKVYLENVTNNVHTGNIMSTTITTIGDSAFEGCTNITEMQLTNALTTVGSRAFASTGLIMIVIPASVNNVERVGSNVFDNCQDLATVIFLNNILGDMMFIDCVGLETISLPYMVTI